MSVQQSLAAKKASVSATPRSFLAAVLSVACMFTVGVDAPLLSATPASTKTKKTKHDPVLKNLPITELSEDEAILHALNRLAYGPRPGDIERVKQMGLAKWIDEQLNPSSIDDKALDARLEDFPTLRMSSAKLMEEYPRPKQVEKQASRRAQAQIEQDQQRRSDVAAAVVARDMQATPPATETATMDAKGTPSTSSAGQSDAADANAPSPMKDDPAQENPVVKGAGKRRALGGGDPNNFARALGEDSKRPQRVIAELAMAKVTRAIYSERQLEQVIDDFWFNHFNVFAGKGEDRYYLTSYERDVIQPHALGKFKDLLTASAKSPAMLFYLDNFLSVDPRAAQREAQERYARQMARYRGWGPPPMPPSEQKKGNERGLNENYGRELMELQTLGVDGGYTQKDVTEVARCFTGWTIDKPRQNPEFKFDDRLHDPDPKIVLGKKIHAGGMKDGEEVISLLAHSPSTAKFISTKLARRFVSDNPAAGIGGAHGADVRGHRRRHPRSDADDDLFPGILVARGVPREDQDAVRTGGLRGARVGNGRGRAAATGRLGGAHRRTALSVPAANGLRGQGGRLGEYGRAAQPAEFFAGAGGQQDARVAHGCWLAVGS